MAVIDFLLHLENPSTWAGVEPVTSGAEGQRQTNHATQLAFIKREYPRGGQGPPTSIPLPPTSQEVVARRLFRVPPAAKALYRLELTGDWSLDRLLHSLSGSA
ncbi:hypothetical protein TNCV_2669311 [Trichonephila clavipes]|nr:hypothetical protein TNCV_2669311 [Trichonephila clavipes]